MRFFRGDKLNCASKCGGEVKIINNIIPEQDLKIIHSSPAMVAKVLSQKFAKGGIKKDFDLSKSSIDKRIR